MNKPPAKRGFVVSPGMAGLVGEAKVKTEPDVPGLPEVGNTGTAPEAPGAAQPVEVAQPPAAAPETPPAPAPQPAAPKAKPWEDLSHGSKGLNLPMSAELYAKMRWCTQNIPQMSLQKLARMGAEQICDQLIAKHYKEEA